MGRHFGEVLETADFLKICWCLWYSSVNEQRDRLPSKKPNLININRHITTTYKTNTTQIIPRTNNLLANRKSISNQWPIRSFPMAINRNSADNSYDILIA